MNILRIHTNKYIPKNIFLIQTNFLNNIKLYNKSLIGGSSEILKINLRNDNYEARI